MESTSISCDLAVCRLLCPCAWSECATMAAERVAEATPSACAAVAAELVAEATPFAYAAVAAGGSVELLVQRYWKDVEFEWA